MRSPIKQTEAELKEVLRETMQKILGSGVTSRALRNVSGMTYDDVVANLHLYERLQVAAAALGALRGYDDKPRGFTKVPANLTTPKILV